MGTAREAYRLAMRDDLLAAAERVIERVGLSGVTIRAILDEAGVAPGTLYTYFSGKDEIIDAVAERVLAQYLAGVPATTETPTDAFVSILETVFRTCPDGAAVVSELRARAGDEEQVAVLRRLNSDIVASLLPRLQQAGTDRGTAIDDPEAFAELLDIIWEGMTRRAGAATFVTDYQRVGRLVTEMVIAPLRRQARTAPKRPSKSRA
jgi:AcrR family transcriptional regulator